MYLRRDYDCFMKHHVLCFKTTANHGSSVIIQLVLLCWNFQSLMCVSVWEFHLTLTCFRLCNSKAQYKIKE